MSLLSEITIDYKRVVESSLLHKQDKSQCRSYPSQWSQQAQNKHNPPYSFYFPTCNLQNIESVVIINTIEFDILVEISALGSLGKGVLQKFCLYIDRTGGKTILSISKKFGTNIQTRLLKIHEKVSRTNLKIHFMLQ